MGTLRQAQCFAGDWGLGTRETRETRQNLFLDSLLAKRPASANTTQHSLLSTHPLSTHHSKRKSHTAYTYFFRTI
ncbi:hypothetical protein [Nostoc sp. CMAA1605]|uniref:hypothetical protein n=1 Tax=Nostoc sp. CMAA1605 TaxID=2055159 RepID=UPI001F2BDABF|nr:hypothetical protein [Nostoc sp. CMAA1605]